MRKIPDGAVAAKLMIESIAAMAPIIVLAFFAGQFIEHFKYSGLDRMLAMWGGQLLGQSGLSSELLVVGFIVMTMVFNLFVGSMSAKYAMFAPIFVPMLMMVGISPELTQAAYRVGDSVSNSITPLNPYMVIILVFMQRFVPKGGMGTLISTMLPYSIAFGIVWTLMLLAWMALGAPLGVGGPLTYTFTAG
jgi:aminobenzoyl-glutamate transport protein